MSDLWNEIIMLVGIVAVFAAVRVVARRITAAEHEREKRDD